MDISVVIRTKNEAYRLRQLLKAIELQKEKDVEVIVVDNYSADDSVNLARHHRCKVVSISPEEFTYGLSLNMGIKEATGEFIAIISGHCVPCNDLWLTNLKRNFCEVSYGDVAGVYGRQLPLPDSAPIDKRDLWNTFGLEKKAQRKDFFFHNANSMIRRKVWDLFPFDEKTRGVEDRVWAKQVIAEGYSIVYEPDAPVYHHHGINQGSDEQRADRVTKVIEVMYRPGM